MTRGETDEIEIIVCNSRVLTLVRSMERKTPDKSFLLPLSLYFFFFFVSIVPFFLLFFYRHGSYVAMSKAPRAGRNANPCLPSSRGSITRLKRRRITIGPVRQG